MAIEQIDLLLLHRPDPLMDAQETGRSLDALIDSGKVEAIGVSNFRPWDIDLLQSCTKNKLLTNQIEISLTQNNALTNGDLAYMQQHDILPMAWSPLGGGELFKNSQLPLNQKLISLAKDFAVQPAAIAIAWLLRHPGRCCPLEANAENQAILRSSNS